MATTAKDRMVSLDVIRGVAVMGILLANLPAFALPAAAYFSPLPWGESAPADLAAWLANFVLVEGKMRGLFSFLFGASMLLVIDRARASGGSGPAVHFPRMAVLFAIGLAHLYLIWWGDILAHYAMVGAFAYLFTGLTTRGLLLMGALTLLLSTLWTAMGWLELLGSAGRDTPEAVATWNSFAASFGVPPAGQMAAEIEATRGAWSDAVRWRWEHADGVVMSLKNIGVQTLSAMLFGMAALRSGFLTGAWPRARYRRWALVSLIIALPAYLALGLSTMQSGFDQRYVFFGSIVASQPFRILAIVGYVALVILLMRPGGGLTSRIAAVGRAAFSNYLATSIVVTAIFHGWGLGLFGHLSRAELYLVAPVVWLAMLAWSKPWLDRFNYGPFEWLWRSLARGRPQPMRRDAVAA